MGHLPRSVHRLVELLLLLLQMLIFLIITLHVPKTLQEIRPTLVVKVLAISLARVAVLELLFARSLGKLTSVAFTLVLLDLPFLI